MAVAACAMRQVLVDRARSRFRLKRGSGQRRGAPGRRAQPGRVVRRVPPRPRPRPAPPGRTRPAAGAHLRVPLFRRAQRGRDRRGPGPLVAHHPARVDAGARLAARRSRSGAVPCVSARRSGPSSTRCSRRPSTGRTGIARRSSTPLVQEPPSDARAWPGCWSWPPIPRPACNREEACAVPLSRTWPRSSRRPGRAYWSPARGSGPS